MAMTDAQVLGMVQRMGELDAMLPPMHASPDALTNFVTTRPHGLGSPVVEALHVMSETQFFDAMSIATALAELRNLAPALAKACAELVTERDKLQAFKSYCHGRLDAAGVAVDPASPHKAQGCRIGGRLDDVFSERDWLRAEVARFKAIGSAKGAMKRETTDRGFQIVIPIPPRSDSTGDASTRLLQQSSAIGEYGDAYDKPGSSFLWVGRDSSHHLSREEVAELIAYCQHWLTTGELFPRESAPTSDEPADGFSVTARESNHDITGEV